jgi:hypothetical protein
MCMRCHWHRMQNETFQQLQKVKILDDTALLCKKCMRCHWHRIHGACRVIGTGCTMNAVSLTQHARSMRCHWYKICLRMQHTRWTIRPALAAFKGNISTVHKSVLYTNFAYVNCSTPSLQNYINLRGLSNKKNRPSKIRNSSQIRSRIQQKGFSPLIRGPGGIDWWQNKRSKISWHCPFNAASIATEIADASFWFGT